MYVYAPASSLLSLFAHIFNLKRGVPTLMWLDGGGAMALIGQRLLIITTDRSMQFSRIR